MCPKHVEPFIDAKIVTSTSLTERLKLWNKYARQPVDTETVRMDFFRKARAGKLYARCRTAKVPKLEENRIKVPSFIKEHYKNRASAIPPPQPEVAQNEPEVQQQRQEFTNRSDLTDDQEEWLSSLVMMQNSLVAEKLEAELKDTKPEPEVKRPAKEKRKRKKVKEKITTKDNNDKPEDSGNESTDSECSLDLDIEDGVSVEAQEEISRFLARNSNLSNIRGLDAGVRDFLAMQRLKEMFAKKAAKDKAFKQGPGDLRTRAALIPLDMKVKQPFEMSYRTYTIGSGSSVDLDLSKFGKCHNVSEKHATIFFDQFTRSYELISYGEAGTIVDNVIYSGDLSLHPTSKKFITTTSKNMKKMAANVEADFACHCQNSPAELNTMKGCEVSAVLNHGSYIRIGCFQFVFTIANYGEDDLLVQDLESELVTSAVKDEAIKIEESESSIQDDEESKNQTDDHADFVEEEIDDDEENATMTETTEKTDAD